MLVRKWILLGVGLALLLTACGPGAAESTPTRVPPRTLTMMTHNSFDIGEEALARFEAEHNVQVSILQAGDAGLMLNQAILSADSPLADVIFGVDNTLLGRALEADILEPYASPGLTDVPGELQLDDSQRLLPVDFGDVCLNYDRAWFEERGLQPPGALEDLTRPEYAGLTVVENPATSSPGLAFLLATVGHFGEAGDYTYHDFWQDMRANDVAVADGWEDAYYGAFTRAGGDRPVVVSYASSPPAEVYFAEQPPDEAPTAAVTGPGSCFRQVEFVGILRGTANRDLAETWIDYMLSVPFQEDIPLHMFVFPANREATLPEVFARFAVVPEQPAQVDYAAIEANREAWIDAWTEVVLR